MTKRKRQIQEAPAADIELSADKTSKASMSWAVPFAAATDSHSRLLFLPDSGSPPGLVGTAHIKPKRVHKVFGRA